MEEVLYLTKMIKQVCNLCFFLQDKNTLIEILLIVYLVVAELVTKSKESYPSVTSSSSLTGSTSPIHLSEATTLHENDMTTYNSSSFQSQNNTPLNEPNSETTRHKNFMAASIPTSSEIFNIGHKPLGSQLFDIDSDEINENYDDDYNWVKRAPSSIYMETAAANRASINSSYNTTPVPDGADEFDINSRSRTLSSHISRDSGKSDTSKKSWVASVNESAGNTSSASSKEDLRQYSLKKNTKKSIINANKSSSSS